MSAMKERRIRRVPFWEDAAWRQMMPPKPDDLLPQDPDVIFLGELAQVSAGQIDEPIQKVLYRVAGPMRDTADVALDDQQFLRPVQTQFVLVRRGDGMRYFERFDPQKHGEWEQIPDTGMTPSGCIEDIYAHGEEFPAIIHDFINTQKAGSASKTHWPAANNPKPRNG